MKKETDSRILAPGNTAGDAVRYEAPALTVIGPVVEVTLALSKNSNDAMPGGKLNHAG